MAGRSGEFLGIFSIFAIYYFQWYYPNQLEAISLTSPEIKKGTITIPVKEPTEEVDISRVTGDIESGIRFEMSLEDLGDHYDSLRSFMEQGGRVFVTESDDYILVNPETGDLEKELLEKSQTGYMISFADSLPGEPGTGGIDNDFYSEWKYFGFAEDAIRQAERINREAHMGDFIWWIVEDSSVKDTQKRGKRAGSIYNTSLHIKDGWEYGLEHYPLPEEGWQKEKMDRIINNLKTNGTTL